MKSLIKTMRLQQSADCACLYHWTVFKVPSTRNWKTQLYFYGHTYRPPASRVRGVSNTFRFKPGEFENPTLRFPVDRKYFEHGAFRKRWRHDSHVISLPESSSNTNPKWPLIVESSLKFSRVVWTENIWCVVRVSKLRVKTPFSNFCSIVWAENSWCVFQIPPA